MSLIYDDSQFVRIINLYKKSEYWTDILETAGNNIIDDIEKDAKRLAPKKTGGLQKRIVGSVSTSGNDVNFLLTSSHPAAAIIEFGGYSPFPPWGPGSAIWEYANEDGYSPDPWDIAKGIHDNQPFKTPQPYIRPALSKNIPRLEKEVVKVAQNKI